MRRVRPAKRIVRSINVSISYLRYVRILIRSLRTDHDATALRAFVRQDYRPLRRTCSSNCWSGRSANELMQRSACASESWRVSGFGTATQNSPARLAAVMPLGESSSAMA